MAAVRYLLAITLFFHLTVGRITKLNTNSTQEQIINSAIEIANQNFNLRKVTVVLFKDVEERMINKFLMSYKGSVIIESKRDSTSPSQVVVIVDSVQSFMKILGKLKPDLKGQTLLNSGARFMILLLSSRKKIERITGFLWTYYVTDVLILSRNKKNTIALYTYFPFKNNLNCQNNEPVLIDFWNKTSHYQDSAQLYPDKMQNMYGCPLYISTNRIMHQLNERKIPLEIIKKSIVRLLRDIMNFKPIITIRDYISIDSDRAKNWSDSLSDVITGPANISTCSIPLGVDRLGLLDYSVPYFNVRLAWIAPPVVPGPDWWRLLSPLNGYLWLVLLMVVSFVKSLPFALKIRPINKFCRRYFKKSVKLQGVGFRIWGVMVGQPIKVAPRRFRDFYIISLWMWFTFVVRSAYQSVLIGALKTDTVVGNFANVKEAVDSGYKFGGRAGIYGHFENDPLIRDGFEIVPESKFDEVFNDVVEGRRKFVIATSLEYAFAYCLAHGKKEDQCGHILPDSIMSVPLVVWMRMYSPFVRTLAVWLPRFTESGLLEHDAMLKTSYGYQITSDPSPLTQHQMSSCLIFLLIGYAISALVFVLEVFKYKAAKYSIVQKSGTI